MEKYINISDVDFKPTNAEYNVIKMSIKYNKGEGVVLYMQEGELKKGEGYNTFSFDMFGSKKARFLIEKMSRKNQKKINEIIDDFLKIHNDNILITLLK